MAREPLYILFYRAVKDVEFLRNLIILILFLFALVGIIILYFTHNLELSHYRSSLDIAIGIAIGTGLLKLLKGRKK